MEKEENIEMKERELFSCDFLSKSLCFYVLTFMVKFFMFFIFFIIPLQHVISRFADNN